VHITTSTPADGPGEFGNRLNPKLELFDSTGGLVANGTPLADGRNEAIFYTVLASGFMSVRVSGEATTTGEYVLTVSGNTAPPPPGVNPLPTAFDFDFGGTQYMQCFRDVQRGGDIDDGVDVGGTNHRALNFTGLTGSSGATWLTVYDPTPDDTTP